MKKKNIIKNILIFVILLILITPIMLNKSFGDLDEIWNYNFARNMLNGLTPYKDFNFLQMPLSPMIASIFLKLLGNDLVVMRILAIILSTIILFLSYLILKNRKIPTYGSLISVIALLYIIKDYIAYDYNYCILAISLLVCYLELKHYDKTNKILIFEPKRDFIIGLIAGLCILFKQTTGLVMAICIIGYSIFGIKSKENIKEYIKKVLVRTLGVLIPVICMLIYLILSNALIDFIDYSILGVKTFSNSISYQNLLYSSKEFIKTACILMPIIWIIGLIFAFKFKDNKLQIMEWIALAGMVVIYPIADEIHFLIGMFITFLITIILSYEVIKIISNEINEKIYKNEKLNVKNNEKIRVQKDAEINLNKQKIYKKITNYIKCFVETISWLIVLISLIYALKSIILYINKIKSSPKVEHYIGVPISQTMAQNINIVGEYIEKEENEVYILDSDSAVFMIPINRYNKDFDMFLKGNLGSKGEEGQIEKLQNMKKGTKILIKNDNTNRNWQNPNKVTEYIKENLEKVDQILYFDVYEI